MTTTRELMSDDEATAVVESLFHHLYDEPITSPERQRLQLSMIACIVIDATRNDILCQPLHLAYARAKVKRGIT